MEQNYIVVTAITAILASLITSLVSPFLLQSGLRRKARAEALRSLMEVEMTRWAGVDHKDYRKKQIELKATVLVANGSRSIVDNYSRLAAISRSFSDLEMKDHYYDGEGGIPTDIAECVSNAANLLSKSLWTPAILRPLNLLTLRKLITDQDKLKKHYRGKRGENSWNVRTI